MILLVVGGVALLTVPHLLPRREMSATAGITLWTSVLALRAVIAVSIAIIAVVYLPATELFRILTQWCFHAVVPFFASHLGFNGHELGDAASLVPALVIGLSATSAIAGFWRAARAVRAWMRRGSRGRGPDDSLLVAGSEPLVAVAGLLRPRIVVSAGALIHLDDAELEAGLEHERGHIRGGHRLISLVAVGLHGISRFLPGGRSVSDHLEFHLERHADEYAVRRTGDPLALASAICKVAGGIRPGPAATLSLLGGGSCSERLGLLLDEIDPADGETVGTRLAWGLALVAVMASAALLLFIPTMAHAGAEQVHVSASHTTNCG